MTHRRDTHRRDANRRDPRRRDPNRRDAVKALAVAGIAAFAPAWAPAWAGAATRRLKVGHTGITWGFKPTDAEFAIKDVATLGFHGFETFGSVIETWEAQGGGGLGAVLQGAHLPLRSAYCDVNLSDPAKRKGEVEKIVRWGGLIKKYGGAVAVIGPNGVKRAEYDFSVHKRDIILTLNEMGKAIADLGLTGALHQHTGTCVETRDETYAVMEAVDTRYVKFGPDVGQLQKGGADPVKVVTDFLPIIRHVHLKDYSGGEHYLGYCPLGQGKVDLTAIVDLLEKGGNDLMIMAELDPSPQMPLSALDAARINKATLEKLGYAFRI
jgi:inosose dehydratase